MSDEEAPYRVLVVDDESSVRKALKWMLYANEYQVVECETGIEAKNILAQDPHFDVVISDISMPHMDGLSLLKHIKAVSNCEVIMLTGKLTVSTVVTAMKEGAFDYLTKPLDNVQDCLIKVKHAAEIHRLKESYQQLQASQKSKKNLKRKDASPSVPVEETIDDVDLFLQKNINLDLSFQEAVTPLEEKMRFYYLSSLMRQSKSISHAARHAKVERSNFKRLLKRYKVDF